jgi:hypothetical protein
LSLQLREVRRLGYAIDDGEFGRGPLSRSLDVLFGGGTQVTPSPVEAQHLVIAGWTGRDPVAVEKHMSELELLGVTRPASWPVFYRLATSRLTCDNAIQVTGKHSSGEVEAVLLQFSGRLWLGVGSDHTDRKLETIDITVSKQVCDKPIAPRFWPFDEVRGHWDSLILRSFIEEDGAITPYQSGSVAEFLEPLHLIRRFTAGESLPERTVMFCGTLPVKGDIRPSAQFIFELDDPTLKRNIRHQYRTVVLPSAS